MAPKSAQDCAKYTFVITQTGPRAIPVPDVESKDEESAVEYNSGGYLQVKIKDTFKDNRYTVVRKLGWGHFSTVWLVKDNVEQRHSALKVVKSACRYSETARDEIKLLRKVSSASPSHPGREFLVSFLDSFQHCGPEDPHVCIVFEPLGENLLTLIERNKSKGVPRGVVKSIAKQVLLGLQYLHEECDLVHTDIKPENIMISIPDVESYIQSELSTSPTPTSRRVGVPPVKTRAGVTIPKGRHDKQVHIFDSQPLPSPPSSTSSLPASPERWLGMQPMVKSAPTSSKFPSSSLLKTMSSSMGSSVPSVKSLSGDSVMTTLTATTSTSWQSTESTILPESLKVITEEPDSACVDPAVSEAQTSQPKDSTTFRHSTGPSLLTQTAPIRTAGLHSDEDTEATPPPPSPILPPSLINIKIADLGNATPSRKHYTEDIQTRQYRSPEAILGRTDWGCSVDIWSVACVIFELLTAEYLFEPKSQGGIYSKDDDHMAQIVELLGDFPLHLKQGAKFSRDIFESSGALRYIKTLKTWPLKQVMMDKYLYSESDADCLCAFLLPMLNIDYKQRVSAGEMVNHEWLEREDQVVDWDLL